MQAQKMGRTLGMLKLYKGERDKMKKIMLCSNPTCCPSIEEDTKNGILYIVDDNQRIAFNKEAVQKLTKYLNER